MRILILCEGDAETWDSWSGSSKSLVDHLRAEGHTVTCGDADLYGAHRLVTVLRNFSPDRRRWWAKYHLSELGFRERSRKATEVARRTPDIDCIIQIGATFEVMEPHPPLVIYCDSSIALARAGAASGFSDATALSADELADVERREAGIYARATMVLTMSERLRRSFIDDLGLAPDRVRTIHAGANFPIGASPVVPARRENRDPTVLFLGRAFHRKGGDLMLRAFQSVRERVPDARLLVVGPDSLPEEFRTTQPGVEFVGFIDKSTDEGRAQLLRAYAEARVFCLPTRFEPFGVAFLEAMHYELPCIGPTMWAVPEIIDHGVTGLLVPPEDAARLADAMVQLLTQPELATRMGEAGKRRLEGHFTWPHVVERLELALVGSEIPSIPGTAA
jgi:glycosyltransferase involved in cell wall biosynthesis